MKKPPPNDDCELAPAEQARLDGWLDVARNADLSDLEHLAAEAPQRRAEHVARLSGMIEAATKPQPARGRRVWVLAAAAGVLLALGGAAGLAGLDAPNSDAPDRVAISSAQANVRQVVGTVIARHPDGNNSIVGADTLIATGDHISTTADGFASLEAAKARVDLSDATTVTLEEMGAENQVFRLTAGRVDVSVPKLPGKKRVLQVKTSDTVVTVLGTAFSVELAHLNGEEVTRVAVTRGVVAVDRAGKRVTLRAGDAWSSARPDPEPEAKAEAPEAPDEAQSPPPKVASSTARPKRAQSLSTSRASELQEQNRAFERAMQARDRGNDKLAISRLQGFLSRFPDAPLRTTVLAELRAAKKRVATD